MTKKCYHKYQQVFKYRDLCIYCGKMVRRKVKKGKPQEEIDVGTQTKMKEFLK